ncbi:hypothetical protein DJ84_07580 [Halorubrum ezzemoulense]|jgi:hypothetical protein|nr:hypothetical protein DJ84_07580 [Halorubrum ezzemoulense]
MPAKRKGTFTLSTDSSIDMLSIEAEGDLEGYRSVYFTDQSPSFDICVTNVSNKTDDFEGSIEGSVRARIEFDEADEDFGPDSAAIHIDLEPGESTTGVLEPDIMTYQGHAAIRIDQGRIRESDGDSDYRIRASSNKRSRIYTFMIYDRDYYRVNYLLPRYSQYLAALLSVLIVAVGIIQITA